MAVRDCYINQHNPIWSGLYLDKNQLYTVDRYGCIVCCAAMCICHRFGITHDNGDETNPRKKQIIEAVIANCCDSNGDFYNNAILNSIQKFTAIIIHFYGPALTKHRICMDGLLYITKVILMQYCLPTHGLS